MKPAEPDEILAVVLRVSEGLRSLGIPHFVTGSFASGIHGVYRQTADVDLVAEIRPDQVEALINEFRGDCYLDEAAIQRALQQGASFNMIHLATSFKVDVFILGERDRPALERLVLVPLGDESHPKVPVSSAEDVVLSKLRWYRLTGETSERQWTDLLGVLGTTGAGLDLTYLRERADVEGLVDLLERALSDAPVG
jgi:hypothetical protein